MKVYLLVEAYVGESSTVHGVFATAAGAEARRDEILQEEIDSARERYPNARVDWDAFAARKLSEVWAIDEREVAEAADR